MNDGTQSTHNPGYMWKQTYEVEQVALDMPDTPASTNRVPFPACNALAPDSVKVCLRPFSGLDSFCQRVYGHPGGHSKKPTTCNRPAGHEGPHAFVLAKDARKLGEWG